MILPLKDWPLSLREYLSERQTVEAEAAVYGALKAPGGFPVEVEAVRWIERALSGLKWREGKGCSIWRRPARA
jgi:hypothetical protein